MSLRCADFYQCLTVKDFLFKWKERFLFLTRLSEMVKEFRNYIAWTDAMREGQTYVGLIEYQHKLPCSMVHALWVIDPRLTNEDDAETAAMTMLEQIYDITDADRIMYSDGVML